MAIYYPRQHLSRVLLPELFTYPASQELGNSRINCAKHGGSYVCRWCNVGRRRYGEYEKPMFLPWPAGHVFLGEAFPENVEFADAALL
jgi:hypothetical protein